MLETGEIAAEVVVGRLDMLCDVPDALLLWRRSIVVLCGRYRVERGDEAAAKDVRESRERRHDRVDRCLRGWHLGRECAGKEQGGDGSDATTHIRMPSADA